MASGHSIDVIGSADFPLRIGTWSTQQRFRVAPNSTNPILGVDCIVPNNIDIITSKRQLRLPNGVSYPLIAPHCPTRSLLRAEPTLPLSVVLAESVVFPPGKSEMIVAGIIQCADSAERYNSSTSLLLFEPLPSLTEKHELVVSASLANNNNGGIPVRILNVGGARKLYKGKRLANIANRFISAKRRSVRWKKCLMPASSPLATARGRHP